MTRALPLALILGLSLAVPATAQEAQTEPSPDPSSEPAEPAAPSVPAEPPAFEGQLVRLVEIIGSLEVLRDLCGAESGQWRARAQALIEAEGEDPRLRRRLIAAYNRGNRELGAYRTCTPSAVFAVDRYMREGERIARDVLVRYGE